MLESLLAPLEDPNLLNLLSRAFRCISQGFGRFAKKMPEGTMLGLFCFHFVFISFSCFLHGSAWLCMEAEETVKEGIDLALPASLVTSSSGILWNPVESCGICPDAPMPNGRWPSLFHVFHGQATECGDQRKEFFGETMLQKPSDCGSGGKRTDWDSREQSAVASRHSLLSYCRYTAVLDSLLYGTVWCWKRANETSVDQTESHHVTST